MKEKLAFVLSGGGARGALQIGSLYALLEKGCRPDLWVGTSIGALNAAFLALHGFSRESLDRLVGAWCKGAELDLLPSNYLRLTLRSMLGRSSVNPALRLREFFIQNGFVPELRFRDIPDVQLVIVSSDLSTGRPVLHGEVPDEGVLEALLVSTALPPWSMPVRRQRQFLMDGGVVSNLPVEAALLCGATRILALDLIDTRETFGASGRLGHFMESLTYAVGKRQEDLELELAKARGVPVLYIDLVGKDSIPILDFSHTEELVAQGYEITRELLSRDQWNVDGPAPITRD